MRNLKKFLALVLAMMMVFSLMVTVNAADTASSGNPYQTAYDTLGYYGIVTGTTGSVDNVTGSFTRAQMALIAYKIATGDVEQKRIKEYEDYAYREFTDLPANYWAAGAIGFCANQGLVVGNGKGKFNPGVEVDGYTVAALMLRLLGYDAYDEFIGPNWKMYAASFATKSGIDRGLESSFSMGAIATRGAAIQMAYAAATQATRVVPILNDYFPHPTATNLIEKVGAADVSFGTWGDPAVEQDLLYTWPISGYKTTVEIPYKMVQEYTTAVDQCQVADDVNDGKNFFATVFTNGNIGKVSSWTDAKNDVHKNVQYNVEVDATNTRAVDAVGRTGRLTRVYKNPLYNSSLNAGIKVEVKVKDENGKDTEEVDYVWYNDQFVIVHIDDLLAEVIAVTKVNRDTAGHVEKEATMTLKVFDRDTSDGSGGTEDDNNYYTTVVVAKGKGLEWEYSVGDYVLINAYQSNAGYEGYIAPAKGEEDPDYGRVYTKTKGSDKGASGSNADPYWNGKAQHVEVKAEAVPFSGTQKVIYGNQNKHHVNDTDYPDNWRFHLDEAQKTAGTFLWFFDQTGKNLIGVIKAEDVGVYGVVTKLYWEDNHGDGLAYADITYVDGNTDKDVVVEAVTINGKTYDMEKGSAAADKNGNFTKDSYLGTQPDNSYRVSSSSSDNAKYAASNYYKAEDEDGKVTAKGDGFVNWHLLRINEVDDNTVVLTVVQTETNATVNAGKSSTTGGNPKNVSFNADSKYLVRGVDSKGYTFTAKTGVSSSTYTKATIDYVNHKTTGYMTYGLIIAGPAAVKDDDPVLAYVNEPSWTLYLNGKPQASSDDAKTRGADLTDEKDVSGNSWYEITGLVVGDEQKSLKTQSWKVVDELTSNVGGLFYLSFAKGGSYITGWCQITDEAADPATNHGAVYFSTVYYRGGVLSDEEDVRTPGAMTINVADDAKIVVTEDYKILDLTEKNIDALNEGQNTDNGVYVITDGTNGKATLIYVVADYDGSSKYFQEAIKETLDFVTSHAPHANTGGSLADGHNGYSNLENAQAAISSRAATP